MTVPHELCTTKLYKIFFYNFGHNDFQLVTTTYDIQYNGAAVTRVVTK